VLAMKGNPAEVLIEELPKIMEAGIT